jgi:ParB family chromosome partitioning protein
VLTDAPAKPLSAFLRKTHESTLGRLLVELVVLQPTASSTESSQALREAAEFYKVDVGAITTKVKQELAAKDKAKAAKTPRQILARRAQESLLQPETSIKYTWSRQ